jgi:hypothetical protein
MHNRLLHLGTSGTWSLLPPRALCCWIYRYSRCLSTFFFNVSAASQTGQCSAYDVLKSILYGSLTTPLDLSPPQHALRFQSVSLDVLERDFFLIPAVAKNRVMGDSGPDELTQLECVGVQEPHLRLALPVGNRSGRREIIWSRFTTLRSSWRCFASCNVGKN